MTSLNRYDQGFGFFGPLEQCKDGKLVLAEEVIPQLEGLIERNKYLEGRIEAYIRNLTKVADAALEQRDEARLELKKVKVTATIGWVLLTSLTLLNMTLAPVYLTH
jgi:hypothetical protein